jgi:hypothetical protein
MTKIMAAKSFIVQAPEKSIRGQGILKNFFRCNLLSVYKASALFNAGIASAYPSGFNKNKTSVMSRQ